MKKDDKVIQFPKRGNVNTEIKIDNKALGLHEDLKYADHLTEGLVINLIHNLGENGIDTDGEEFIADVAFLIEFVKSTIHRDMGIKHPLQKLVDMFIDTEDDGSGNISTEFDLESLEKSLMQNEVEEE